MGARKKSYGRWLWTLSGTIILVPVGLEMGYIWQAGLDLHTPRNVRGYLELLRRSREDIAGKALWAEARHFDDPLTVLLPGGNTSDRDITASLTSYLEKHGHTAADLTGDPELRRRFFQAHTFALKDLHTGTLKTLDGKTHNIRCQTGKSAWDCTVDGRGVHNYFKPFGKIADDGSLYTLELKPGEQATFLPFLN